MAWEVNNKAWKTVDSGGAVMIYADAAKAADGTLLDGSGIEDCSLSVSTTSASFRPMESRSEIHSVTTISYQIRLNRGLEDSSAWTGDTGTGKPRYQNLLSATLLTKVYLIYYGATGDKAFEGWCTWESLEDTQRSGEFAKQSLALTSSGDPVYPVLTGAGATGVNDYPIDQA